MADIGKKKSLSETIVDSDPTDLEKLQEKQDQKRAARRRKQAFKDIDATYRYEEDKVKARQNYEWREKERQLKEEHDVRMENLRYQAKYGETWQKRLSASLSVDGQQFVENIQKGIGNAVGTVMKAATQSVDNAIGLLNQYQASVSTRAQGAKTFNDLYEMIRKNIGASPYVRQTAVLENLSRLVDEGIIYNVAQRAFLNTIKDEIATTFDAANGTLLRIIRIQQADTTAARLGMEAYLTRFLNSMFEDSSYLKDTYDTVAASLIDLSSSTRTPQESAELEFIAQKWLGSLASIGVSDSTLQMIAQGINAIGSGNISELSGNTAMQSLFAMATSRTGGSVRGQGSSVNLGDVLSYGLTSDTLNQILESIVTYGQEIASSNNAVVRNLHGQQFGLSVSDLRALQNLNQDTISKIANTMMPYEGMISELSYQYSQISGRVPISQMVSNVLDNLLTRTGMNIATTPAAFAAWVVNDLIEKATGGINIPTIGSFGNFVDLNANINQLAKVAMVGIPLMASVGTAIGGLFDGKDMLDLWGLRNSNVETRGGYASEVSLGESVTKKTSQSTYIGTTESSDIYAASVTSAKEEAMSEVKSEEEGPSIEDAIMTSIDPNIKAILELLDRVVNGSSYFHVAGRDLIPSTTPYIGGMDI